MDNNQSRFTCDYPGIVRMAWYMVSSPSSWREKSHAWIVDHERGAQFQLSDDEELMLRVLSENMHDVIDSAGIPLWKSNKFWSHDRIFAARDRVLAAISDRRHDNPREWERLEAMKPNEWLEWLRTIIGTDASYKN